MRCYHADIRYDISRKSTCYAMHLQMSSRAALQACRTTKQLPLREHLPGSWRAGDLGEACCRWGHLSPSLLAHSHHEIIVSAEGPCLALKHCQLCSLESASTLKDPHRTLKPCRNMQGSKSLLKRKREVDAEEQVERDARQLRREMRMRGHVVR